MGWPRCRSTERYDRFNLYLRSLRQGFHLVAGSSGIWFCKETGVNLVDLNELPQVSEEYSCLDRVGERRAGSSGNCGQVPEALIGLGDGIFGVELASRWVDRQLAGDVKQIANLDSL